jgi:hypothetical protein
MSILFKSLMISSVPPHVIQQTFTNFSFNEGTNGWTIFNQRVNLDGTTILAGYKTPKVRSYSFPIGFGGTDGTSSTYSTEIITNDNPIGSVPSLKLKIIGYVPIRASLYGPAVYSNYFVPFNVGDTISFQWKVTDIQNSYDIYAYLVKSIPNTTEPTFIELLNETDDSNTNWVTKSIVIANGQAGNYACVFVAGAGSLTTFSGGFQASLLIDNIQKIEQI